MKNQILAMLEQNKGSDISGSEIARRLGISRSAVWKSIKQLQSEGYPIGAATNRGYRLAFESDILSEQSIQPLLKTAYFGRNMDVFKTIDSTNTFAKGLAQCGEAHGKVVLSEMQTNGRGRLERNFYSPGSNGIYMSLILRPRLSMESASLITSCAAVAVAEAIEAVAGIDTKIKWVNDIYAGGKKLCGILTEAGMDFESGSLEYAVVGIGINVSTAKFPEALRRIATSIALESKRDFSRSALIAEVLNRFEAHYSAIEHRSFLPEYIRRSNVIGQEITVIALNRTYPAVAVGIDDMARLRVRLPDGTEQLLNSGEISIRLTD